MGLFLKNNILKYEAGDETRIIKGDTANYKYSIKNGILLFIGTGNFLNNNYLIDRNSNDLFELKQENNNLQIVSVNLGSGSGLTQEEHDKLMNIKNYDDTDIKLKINELLNIEKGNWEIKNNQMIFYKVDGTEEMRFNLFDKNGNLSDTNVYKRVMV